MREHSDVVELTAKMKARMNALIEEFGGKETLSMLLDRFNEDTILDDLNYKRNELLSPKEEI